MAWFKVDDKLHSHRKTVRAGAHAMGLWTIAGSWCADHLTDGFIPDYIAVRLDPDAADLADRLVEAGLWTAGSHDGDDGWWFHGWDEYQPTRSQVDEKRESDRERKRRQRRSNNGRYTSDETPTDHEAPSQPVSESVPPESARNPNGVTPSRPDPTRPDPKPHGVAKAPRKQDPIFDALIDVCRLDPGELTKSARGRVNRAAKELRDIGASPDGIRARARVHQQRWQGVELTPTSLSTNYAQLGSHPRGSPSDHRPVCPDCEQPLDAHDDDTCEAIQAVNRG